MNPIYKGVSTIEFHFIIFNISVLHFSHENTFHYSDQLNPMRRSDSL